MKKYTRAALEVICEYFDDVASYFPDILDKSKEELIASYHYYWLTEATAEMIFGPCGDPSIIYEASWNDLSVQYCQYQRILPYAKALGIRLDKGYAQVCKENDCWADRAIEKMIELVTDTLLQGIKDNWEYLTSDEW